MSLQQDDRSVLNAVVHIFIKQMLFLLYNIICFNSPIIEWQFLTLTLITYRLCLDLKWFEKSPICEQNL